MEVMPFSVNGGMGEREENFVAGRFYRLRGDQTVLDEITYVNF